CAVRLPRRDERMECVKRVDPSRTVVPRGYKFLSKPVVERRITRAYARAPIAYRDDICNPIETHFVVGGEGPVRELVTDGERAVDVQADTRTDRARETVA